MAQPSPSRRYLSKELAEIVCICREIIGGRPESAGIAQPNGPPADITHYLEQLPSRPFCKLLRKRHEAVSLSLSDCLFKQPVRFSSLSIRICLDSQQDSFCLEALHRASLSALSRDSPSSQKNLEVAGLRVVPPLLRS